MTRSVSKLIAIGALFATLLTGCYGQFAATRKVYNWNGGATKNPYANSAIMWGLLIIPVYELCWLGDFLIFNTIEVVSGKNPIATNDNGVLNTKYAGHDYQLRTVGKRIEVLVDGKVSYYYRENRGQLVVEDLNGKVVRTVSTAHATGPGSGFGTM